MNIGDPKKSAILAVVALVVLGVAVVRIVPDSDPPPGKAAADAVATESARSGASQPSMDLRRDPFYHPALEVAARAPAETEPSSDSEQSTLPPLALPNAMAQGGMPWGPDLALRPSGPDAGSKPAESTGSDQQVKQKRVVTVNAVMTVARPLAYVAVDGDEFRVGVGDKLPGVGKVVSIAQRSVTVAIGREKLELLLGQQVEL